MTTKLKVRIRVGHDGPFYTDSRWCWNMCFTSSYWLRYDRPYTTKRGALRAARRVAKDMGWEVVGHG